MFVGTLAGLTGGVTEWRQIASTAAIAVVVVAVVAAAVAAVVVDAVVA